VSGAGAGGWPEEQPALFCARLLACGHIEADLTNPDAGYSLRNILVHIRPADGGGFPFRTPRVWLFAQLYGSPAEYVIRVRMTRIGEEDGEAVEIGESVEFGPWEIALPGDGNYVECVGIPLVNVPFREPGVYEFQLWADGADEMLHNERVEARE
jgi:hypothetical protein